MKKLIYPAALILLFIILTTTILPADAVYGSNTDWFSQHAALAETIRDACVEQHTLLPDWIDLGSGSSGYQFSYYGYSDRMSVSADSYGLHPDRLYACTLSRFRSFMLYVAAKRGYFPVLFLHRKRFIFDCGMSFPYASSDHVCQLSAVFDPCFFVREET